MRTDNIYERQISIHLYWIYVCMYESEKYQGKHGPKKTKVNTYSVG